MIDINPNPQTIYKLINHEFIAKHSETRIEYGLAMINVFNKAKAKDKDKIKSSYDFIKRDKFYLISKFFDNDSGNDNDGLYLAFHDLNSILGWGSDQIHIHQKDLSGKVVIQNGHYKDDIYYFFELARTTTKNNLNENNKEELRDYFDEIFTDSLKTVIADYVKHNPDAKHYEDELFNFIGNKCEEIVDEVVDIEEYESKEQLEYYLEQNMDYYVEEFMKDSHDFDEEGNWIG